MKTLVEQSDPSSTIDGNAAVVAAIQHGYDKPPWSTGLLVLGIAALVISGLPYFIDCGERSRRRVYWSGILVGTSLMAVAVSWRGWSVSAGLGLAGVGIACCFAFFYDGSLLTLGNWRISYTMDEAQRRAAASTRDAYLGVVSARNHWWLIAFLTCGLAAGLYVVGWTWTLSLSVVAAVAAAALSGWDDATRGLSIARGQKVQFAIASIASLMMFAVPLFAYLTAYFCAKKRRVTRGRHAASHDPELGREPD